MKTYARNVNNQAVDVTTTDPALLYHPDVAAQFVVVPNGTQNGATYDGSTWKNPPAAPAPVAPVAVLPKLTPMTFYLAFTLTERIKIKTSTDPVVVEFWDTYQRAERTNTDVDPNLISVQEGLQYLTTTSPPILASADRVAAILAGTPQ